MAEFDRLILHFYLESEKENLAWINTVFRLCVVECVTPEKEVQEEEKEREENVREVYHN
jgi:hypothetical protein